MAFANKIGSLFRHAINSSPSIYQSIRSMSSSKIFVGGISYNTDDQGLREAFTSFGEVIEARVILDRETQRSRGFGFVTFTSEEEASAAISGMDGKDLHGRMVRVNYANDRPTGGFRSGGGYGGGGYGGGGYGGGGYSGGGGGYSAGGYGGSGGNFPSGDDGVSSFNSGGAGSSYGGSGNHPSGDSAPSSFDNGGAGGDLCGSSAMGSSGGFAKEDVLDSMKDDDPLDSMKDDDSEPDDYANKQS